MAAVADDRPLVAHVVHRFAAGGLENGVVNLINHGDAGAFRHAVVALTEVTGFADRITRGDVTLVSLHKPPGQGWWQVPAWTRLLRELRPAIVHTRNIGALDMQLPARLAGVPVRIHGEHGRDMSDPHGTRRRYRWLRRLQAPLVHRFVALSGELERYLVDDVGLAPHRVTRLHNGVDTQRFAPWTGAGAPELPGCPFQPRHHRLIGSVGRLQPEKDPITLVRALRLALTRQPEHTRDWRLVMVGDGPERTAVEAEIHRLGLADRIWLAGERRDIPQVLQAVDVFALPSRAEGISNTILEAMACGLPVVATDVGGNAELVQAPHTGLLVPAHDPAALAQALWEVLGEARVGAKAGEPGGAHAGGATDAAAMGAAGRARVLAHFSLNAMVTRYESLYRELLQTARRGVQ